MPSLYINYYLCHCDQPVAFQCNTLPFCRTALRSSACSISSRLGRFASETLPSPSPPRPPATLSRTIARTPEWPTFRSNRPPPFMPLALSFLPSTQEPSSRTYTRSVAPRSAWIPWWLWNAMAQGGGGRGEGRRESQSPRKFSREAKDQRRGAVFGISEPRRRMLLSILLLPPPLSAPSLWSRLCRGRAAKISRLTGQWLSL